MILVSGILLGLIGILGVLLTLPGVILQLGHKHGVLDLNAGDDAY
jgi:hypothetical protein